MTKKLLYIVNDAPYFVSHRLELAKAAQAHGYDVSVATKDGSQNSSITEAGIHTNDIPIQRGSSTIGKELKTLRSLIRLFRQNDWDIVHAITIKTTLWAGLAGRLTGQKNIVFALTGLGFIFTDNSPRTRLFRSILIPLLRFAMNGRYYRSIFQNSDDMALFESLKIISSCHGVLIKGSGVDPDYFSPFAPPDKPVTVLYSGRLLKIKGIEDYVRAATLIKTHHPNVRFCIAGGFDTNNPSCITPKQMNEWVDKEIIEYLGQVRDIRDALKQCHIVCLPSHNGEGIPKSLIEAASCGLPIITTDIPGCREIVKDGENGILVPPKSPEALANAIQGLIFDKTLRQQFGANGRKRVEKELSISHVIEQTLSLYQSIVS